MIDTSQIDLLQLCGKDTILRHAANTRGGEYAGACPLCGGEDRFRVQPAKGMWCCRQCHERWGDAIEYLKWHDGMDFKTAVETLKLPLDNRATTRRAPIDPDAPKPLGSEYIALNDPDWQEAARVFCYDAVEALWSDDGAKARDYLRKRGISEEVMQSAGLGYCPIEDYKSQWGLTDVWFPRSIIIPWRIGDTFWRVNCRPPQPVNGRKYIQAAGSANGLYNADAIKRNQTVVITEGEFDSLVIRTHAPFVTAVATGTVSWARVTRWVARLSVADEIVLAFDTDAAGEGAVTWWQKSLGDKAHRLAPTEHDVTDMWKAGKSVSEWLQHYNLAFSMPITEDMERRRQIVREQVLPWGYESIQGSAA